MPDQDVWNSLAWLESQDAVKKRYEKLHGRELNSKRRLEVTASARQAREYFRNVAGADLAVRPLLTFYGISSLSRACILVLGQHSGETSLSAGHGLTVVDWRTTLAGEMHEALARIGELKMKSARGLFSDLAKHTDQMTCIHINSSGVDWAVKQPTPTNGIVFQFDDLAMRMPDLAHEMSKTGKSKDFLIVDKMTFSHQNGFNAELKSESIPDWLNEYSNFGYSLLAQGGTVKMAAQPNSIVAFPPQFLHKHLDTFFGIPSLAITPKIGGGVSEICALFGASFFLGMLSRYFPSHWMSLVNGANGDEYRSTLLVTQALLESTFPVLVEELLSYRLK